MSDASRHWDEYKLLQEKLDRVGDFRFRVKAWLVSLVTAMVVGASLLKLPSVGFLGLPIIGLFWMMERYYDVLQSGLSKRLNVLEPILRKQAFNDQPKEARSRRADVGPQLVQAIHQSFAKHKWLLKAHGYFYLGFATLVTVHVLLSLLQTHTPERATAIHIVRPVTVEMSESASAQSATVSSTSDAAIGRRSEAPAPPPSPSDQSGGASNSPSQQNVKSPKE